jgi:OmpA-OmpF porin, OOP family
MASWRLALMAGAFCALAAPGLAETGGQAGALYLRGEAGFSFATDADANGSAGPIFTETSNSGPVFGGALGLRLTPIRIELGLDIMRYDAGKVHFINDGGLGTAQGIGNLTGQTVPVTGTIQNIPVMANLYYDFDTGTPLDVYVGMGIGASALTLHNISASGARLFDTSQLVFAYQPMIGVNYAITDQIAVGLQYRYFATADATLRDASGHVFSVSTASHNVLASLTYYFTPPQRRAAAPTPDGMRGDEQTAQSPETTSPSGARAAAGARPARREFLVFFNFDRATLTAASRRVIDEAIAAYQRNRTNTIVVRGFTDAVGSVAYNLDLSRRRALAVYRYMAAKKVAPADMGIDWQGENDLRVATQKREPQNRRVEIHM